MKHKQTLLLQTLLLILAFSIKAQDTLYIKKFPYKGSFEINTGTFTQSLDISQKGNNADSARARYIPNINNTIGFNFSWKFISLGYSFKMPVQVLANSTYGNTRFLNFNVSTYTRRIGAEAFFRKYERFYQSDLSGNIKRRADLNFLHTGLHLFLFANSTYFCYRAPFTQARKQLKSAGGFLMMTEFSYKKFSGDSSFLPKAIDVPAVFDRYASLKSLSYGIIELKPGYAYDFVFQNGKFYVCPLLLAGIGVSPYHYKTDSIKGNTVALHLDFNFKLAFGYDVEHFFMNLIVQADKNTNFLRKNLLFSHTLYRADLTAGWRFGREKKKSKQRK